MGRAPVDGGDEVSRYGLLVSLHVLSVIAWVGSSTTIVFVTFYARRARNRAFLDQLGGLVDWLSIWVLAPASLAAAGFGVLAAHAGHWPEMFWFHVGEGAFSFSFLLTVGVRIPLLRRGRRQGLDAVRLSRYVLAVALAELTVLYLAVADMVTKPTAGNSEVTYGAVILAAGLLAAAALAYRARTAPSQAAGALEAVSDAGRPAWPVGGFEGGGVARRSQAERATPGRARRPGSESRKEHR